MRRSMVAVVLLALAVSACAGAAPGRQRPILANPAAARPSLAPADARADAVRPTRSPSSCRATTARTTA